MAKEFAPEGVQFIFLYVREAHPGDNKLHHSSLKQKLQHARDFVEMWKIDRPMYVDDFDGPIHRLAKAPPDRSTPPFPKKLSKTGLFASTKDHIVAPGVIPYSVNSPLWSDGAAKLRYLALPPGGKARMAEKGSWGLPDGSVLVKTFLLDADTGVKNKGTDKGHSADTGGLHRLETRLLHREHGQWRFYTYIWNDQQTDATLLKAEGADRVFRIHDAEAPGGVREQRWRFPRRTECGMCHTRQSRFVLGLTTRQLNRDLSYRQRGGGHVVDNQIRMLRHAGLIANPGTQPPDKLPRYADPYDAKVDLTARARSYPPANCAHCHQRDGGGGRSDFQLNAWLKVEETGAIDGRAEEGHFNIANARIIAPGDPGRSVLLHRTATRGVGQMPKVGTNIADRRAVEMLRQWIEKLPTRN